MTAAAEAASTIRALLAEKETINCIFAAAPSQNEFLQALLKQDIEWNRINAFHMDDYVGFAIGDPRSFNGFLSNALFDLVPFHTVNLIDGQADLQAECARYTALLDTAPPDIVFMGIGENGHIAFNDPPVADFEDSKQIKVVELELACRVQQVNDNCFPCLEEVPTQAFTLTIPAMVRAQYIYCIVPGDRKAAATAAALTGEISTACPASILRNHENCRMYIDKACASLL